MLLQPQDTRSGGSRGPCPTSPRPRWSHTREVASSQGQAQSCPARRCYLPAAPGLLALLSTGRASNGKRQDNTNSHPLAEKGDCRREVGAFPARGDQCAPVTATTPSHSRAGCAGGYQPGTSQCLSLEVHRCHRLCKAQRGSGPGSSNNALQLPASTQGCPQYQPGRHGSWQAPGELHHQCWPSGSLQAPHTHTNNLTLTTNKSRIAVPQLEWDMSPASPSLQR